MITKTKTSVLAGALLAMLLVPGTVKAQTTDLALVFRMWDAQQAVVTPTSGPERTATLGERLNGGDAVTTTESTRAAIKFSDDGSLVRLSPSSQLIVTAEGDDRQSMVKTLDMNAGELWARVTSSNADNPTFRVQTPSGVAAVKGTEFIVRVDGNGTTIITLEGVVEFFNNAGTVDVTEGNLVQVPTLDDAPVPREVQQEDVGAAQQLIDDDAADDDDTVSVEITVQDANGRTRTLLIDMPRDQARAILGGGE